MPTSALEAISPAIELMKRRLFRPFRFAFWTRMAIVGILSGELGGHGSFNFSNWNVPNPSAPAPMRGDFVAAAALPNLKFLLPIIAIAAVVMLALIVVLLYVSSRMRFVLFEAVLRDRLHIREGWRRWEWQAMNYFVFQLKAMIILIGGLCLIAGLPLAAMYTRGYLHRGMSISSLVALIAIGLAAVVYGIGVSAWIVLTKDFVVPQMALEGVPWEEGWRRVWPAIKSEKGSTAAYLVLKAVLTMVAMILLAIVLVVFVLILIAPVVAVVVVLATKGVLAWNIATVAALVVVVPIAIAVILYAVGFLGAPISVFFPAYSMYYFAARYEPLRRELYPAPPAPPAPPVEPGLQPA